MEDAIHAVEVHLTGLVKCFCSKVQMFIYDHAGEGFLVGGIWGGLQLGIPI